MKKTKLSLLTGLALSVLAACGVKEAGSFGFGGVHYAVTAATAAKVRFSPNRNQLRLQFY